MAADDRWYFTAEKIKDSPSRKCGIDADKELSYRQQAANLIQDMGQSLNVNQLCMNTAIVYMHRFYMFHSFTKYKWNSMAACCLFLGAKVEEQPRKLEHVIKVHHSCLHRDSSPLDTMKDRYLEIAQEMVVNENILLQTLGFDIGIEQPNSHVVNCCELVRASRDLAQTSYFMANESLHLTTMCLQYKPTVVACVCIHLACKWGKWELPKSSEDRPWFWYVDRSVSVELLEELTSEFLGILEKSPNRLKRKLMNARKDGEFGHLHKKEGSSSSHGEHSVKKDMRNHDKNYRESASSSGQASSSSMPSHPSAHSSSSNHKKRLLPGDEKASPSNPLHGADRPQKKPKVDGHSLSIDEWKERREKENMQHKIPVDHMKHNSSQMPHMKQMEKSRQPYDKHRPHHGEHHHRTDHKNVVPHRENHKAEHDKNRHHRPPYHKERLPSDKYHMMKHPGSGHDQSHIVKSKLPVKAEVNDLKKSDSVPRVPPPQTHIDEGRLKPPIESASLNQASNISRSNNDQKNMSSDKLFDDLMNASNPIHTGPPPDIFASSNVKNDIVFNSSVNENFAKQDSRTIYPVSTNGDEAADASLSVPRTSPKRRLHSNSQKTPPSSDIRRSNRHKTPPLTSPVGDLKTISPMKEPSSAGSSDMQPVVKITRMEMDKQSIPDAPVDIRVPSTVVHDNLNAHGYQSSSESMSANQFIMQLPIRKEPVVMDKSLESRQHLETVPIVSKHKEKSKKDRHKSSKKEKHRHKHSHSDSHREKNHSLKISIPKDKISMSDNNPVESGGGLKLKIHKGRLANDVSENENSVNAVGGGLKLVIHKSKIGSGGGADTNGTAIKSERKRDRSPRQKSPKLSRSHKHQSVEESDEFIQVQNPYYMPPFKSESGYYANAQQYCPAPAAIHPATANTTVRPPSISGYTMYGSAYQQHQQPPLPSLPPPQPPPPPTK